MARCRDCQADIVWVVTIGNGRKMPLDAAPDREGNITKVRRKDGTVMTVEGEYGPAEVVKYVKKGETRDPVEHHYTSHFATCPKADERRRS